MVFTKLSVQEKDAFFGLLDEYFQSRPELFGQSNGGQGVGGLAGTGISTAAATSVVQRALAASTTGGTIGASGKSNNPYVALMPVTPNNVDVAPVVPVGRVAAASLALSQAGGGSSASPSPSPFSQIQRATANLKPAIGDGAPALPRRVTSNTLAPAAEQAMLPGAEVDKLVTRKTSVFSSFKKPPAAGVSIPPAFVVPKNTFGPPPVRRTTLETSVPTSTGTGGTSVTQRDNDSSGGTAVTRTPPTPEVAEGEWAEALYDYNSEDPGDLTIEAGTRVFVTAKSSEDWWTGQVEGQGREGLFPASYVKLL